MRTTLDLDRPALAMIRSVARNRRISLGKAATALILQSAASGRKSRRTKDETLVRNAGPPVTMQEVKAALEGED